MNGQDEIIFTGEYKSFKLGVRFDISDKKPEDVAAILSWLSEQIEPHSFVFAGVDTKKIDTLASACGNGFESVITFLGSKTQTEFKAALLATIPKPELMTAAESCLMNTLLGKTGVGFKVTPAQCKGENEKPEDVIAFIGKYKEWIAIKKLGLENAKEYEVSGILSGINFTIVNKAFDFAGARKDAVVDEVTNGKRKSYGNLLGSLESLTPKLAGLNETEKAYAICKTFEKIGYRPYSSPEMLTAAYPDIKPPKVKGRKPKG